MNQTLVLRLVDLSHKTSISSTIWNIHTSDTFARYLSRVAPMGKAVPGTILCYVCGLYLLKAWQVTGTWSKYFLFIRGTSGLWSVKNGINSLEELFSYIFHMFLLHCTVLSLQRVIYTISKCLGPVRSSPTSLTGLWCCRWLWMVTGFRQGFHSFENIFLYYIQISGDFLF